MTNRQPDVLRKYSYTWEVRTAPLTQVQLVDLFENIVDLFQSQCWEQILLTFEGRMETDHNDQPELKMKRLNLTGLCDFFKHEIQTGHIVLGGYALTIASEFTDIGFTFTPDRDVSIMTSEENLIREIHADWSGKGFSPSHVVVQTWYTLPSGGSFFMNMSIAHSGLP